MEKREIGGQKSEIRGQKTEDTRHYALRRDRELEK